MNKHLTTLIILLFLYQIASAQSTENEAPGYSLYRANESYEYLKNKATSPFKTDFFDPIKFVPLNARKNMYVSFGGQFRPRIEYYSNRLWDQQDDPNFYAQRMALHTDLVLGKNVRVFGELYHGYVSQGKEFLGSDQIDFHQAFVDFKFLLPDESQFIFRFGRQEMAYGATRLVGLREGPNIRRTFDAARMTYEKGDLNIQTFYAQEVIPGFNAFDNQFQLFDGGRASPALWGAYSQFKIKGFSGTNECYYFGFESNDAVLNDIAGKEKRHSIGIRRFGKIGKRGRFRYNTEIIYQFGKIDDVTISAFDLEGDWHYQFTDTSWEPDLGLKLQYTSGDRHDGDGRINTFNPMFVNPAYYSLAATISPINVIGVHPSISVSPIAKSKIYVEWALFWRASKDDGLYRPPRFINRQGEGISERKLGHQFGLKASYEFNRHLSFDFDLSYFIAGEFQRLTGNAENILHVAPTISFKF